MKTKTEKELEREIEELMQKCRINTQEDYAEWIAEAITLMGGMSFIKLIQNKSKLEGYKLAFRDVFKEEE